MSVHLLFSLSCCTTHISLPAPFTIPLILVNSDSSLFIIPTPLHYYCYLKSFPLLLVVNLVKPDEREDPSLLSFVIFSFSPFFFAGCVLSTFFRGDWARVWRHLRFEQVPRALLEMHHRRNEINIPNWILNSYCVWCVLVSPAEFLFFSSRANCSARLSPPVKLWATLARNTLFSRALPFSLVCSSLHLLLFPTLGTHIGSVPDRIGEWVMRRIVYSVSPRQSLSPPLPLPLSFACRFVFL